MPRKNIEVNLELMKRNSISQFIVKQLDDVTLEISLFENNKMYDISNATTRLFVGTNNDLYMQDSDIVISENKATIKLDRSILQDKGCAYAELEITDSNGSVATPSFLFDIDKRVSEGLKGNIEGFVEKYERLIAEFRVQVNNAVMDNYNRTTTAISVFETNGNVVISKIKSDGENAISTFNTNASNKLTEYENRFQKLTASQQQSAEVVDARDGEISLHARLERDLAKGKIIEETVSENYITIKDSVDGSITDIEILGNTVQSVSDLSDIQSVGTLREDGLYEMSILSCGKNLFDKSQKSVLKTFISTSKVLTSNNNVELYIVKCKPNTTYTISKKAGKYFRLASVNTNPYANMVLDNIVIGDTSTTLNITTGATHRYLLLNFHDSANDTISISEIASSIQIEEGAVATTYEPYQVNKSSILLPCQLEKVGDIKDRLFRREDGVWCIEKNIGEVTLNGSENWTLYGGNSSNTYAVNTLFNSAKPSTIVICDRFKSSNNVWQDLENNVGIYMSSSSNGLILRVLKSTLDTQNVAGVKSWLSQNPTLVKYQLATPQIIELPLNQQIQLNSYNGVTNIFTEDTVIEPTIKATVPKSLGASVNSLVNKTDILSNRIEKVETLQEGNELEISTDNGYVVCENTNNGQIEELKVEGKTLVNLSKLTQTQIIPRLGIKLYDLERVVAGQYYTIVYTIKTSTNDITNIRIDHTTKTDFPITVGTHVAKFRLNDTISGNTKIYLQGTDSSSITVENVILLEGDHTQNPPSYFEGLKSVGDGTDKIEVLSRKEDGNLNSNKSYIKGTLDNNSHVSTNRGIYGELYIEVSPNTTYRVTAITSATIETYKTMLCNASKNFIKVEWERTFTTPSNCRYVRVGIVTTTDATSDQANSFKMQLEEGTDTTTYKECIQNKKQILIQNSDRVYEKPILRSTGSVSDTIEKHSDGKYYYHKRCGEVVLNGAESWTFVPTYTDETYLTAYISLDTLRQNTIAISNNFTYITGGFEQLKENFCVSSTTQRFYFKILKSKLTSQDVTGFKTWLSQNPVTVVYQLVTEEVYECVNLDLDSYEGETSVIVDSGAISPKLTFKISSHIGNTINVLKDRINYLEDKVINMFKAVLSGDVQTLAYELYPEDFENSDTTEEVEILEDTSVVEETVEDTESLQNHT